MINSKKKILKATIKYGFTATPWQHASPGGWYFVSLPPEMSREIRSTLKQEEEGWGRLKATARIGTSEWKTAIWFDTKSNTYLLPLKAAIRKQEKIDTETGIEVTVWL